ncbi:MAG: SRPBCC family protein [Methanobacteriota archaeon]
MLVLDKRIEIRASPEKVFEYVSRVERLPRWLPAAVRADTTEGRRGHLGSVVHEILGFGPAWMELYAEVCDVEENRCIEWHGIGGDFPTFDTRFDLTPTATGTLLRMRVQVAPPPDNPALTAGAPAPEIGTKLSADLDQGLLTLKELLEPV